MVQGKEYGLWSVGYLSLYSNSVIRRLCANHKPVCAVVFIAVSWERCDNKANSYKILTVRWALFFLYINSVNFLKN